MTEREFWEAIEIGKAEFERQRKLAEQCMPVLIERRSDGYQHVMLVSLGFNLAPILEGDWFAPKLTDNREIA